MRSREEILGQLVDILDEMFEVPPDTVVLEAHLVDDLDIDSIDAVDMLAKLRETNGIQIDPEQFKSVQTVADVVNVIADIEAA